MSRIKTIVLDIDGVIAGGGYILPEDRTIAKYYSLSLREDVDTRTALNQLILYNNVYIASSRRVGDRNMVVQARNWLEDQEINVEWICGIACGLTWEEKITFANTLHADVIVDDDVRVVAGRSGRALLMDAGWPENQAAQYLPRIYSLRSVEEWLDA